MSRVGRFAIQIKMLTYAFCLVGFASTAGSQSSALVYAGCESQESTDLGRFDDITIACKALKLGELEYGPNHSTLVPLIDELAGLMQRRGRHEEAEPLFQRALEIRERSLGRDHPDVAIGSDNLGWFYEWNQRYDEAEASYERALALRKSAFGDDHLLIAKSLKKLGWLNDRRGNCDLMHDYLIEPYRKERIEEHCDKATQFLKDAIAVVERTLGTEHHQVALYIRELAGMYAIRGDFEASETLHGRSLAIIEITLGPNHPELAIGLEHLAIMFSMQGRDEEAAQLWRRISFITQ